MRRRDYSRGRGPLGGWRAHRCLAPVCETTVPRDRLMCRRHWGEIPRPLRDEIWRTWDDGRGYGTAGHTAAVKAGIASLEGK